MFKCAKSLEWFSKSPNFLPQMLSKGDHSGLEFASPSTIARNTVVPKFDPRSRSSVIYNRNEILRNILLFFGIFLLLSVMHVIYLCTFIF